MDKLSTLPSLEERATSTRSRSSDKSASSEEEVIDMKIQMLESENFQQSKKIRSMNGELRQLLGQLDEKKRHSERTESKDKTLMGIVKSRKLKQQKLILETSLNTKENAFEVQREEEEETPKASCRTPTFLDQGFVL